jgi:hypothetical protein
MRREHYLNHVRRKLQVNDEFASEDYKITKLGRFRSSCEKKQMEEIVEDRGLDGG